MIRQTKSKITDKYPYAVSIPKNVVSPTDSIYKDYDIVSQGRALHRWEGSRTIRSAEFFIITVKMPDGRIREYESVRKVG